MTHFPLAVRPYVGPCYLTAPAATFGGSPAINPDASDASVADGGQGASTLQMRLAEFDLNEADKNIRSVEVLTRLYRALPASVPGEEPTDVFDALWEGAWALKRIWRSNVEDCRNAGALLHIGCARPQFGDAE